MKERISSNVQRQTRLRVDKAAKALGISKSAFIKNAVEADLDKLDIRIQLEAARKQRDDFKAKYEAAETERTAAIAKITALENRGLLARIFNKG